MKKCMHLVVSLTAISAVCAAILAWVNAATVEQIKSIRARATQNAARLVMPRSVKTVEAAKTAEGVDYFVGKGPSGQVLAYALKGTSSAGYGGDVVLMIGFLPDSDRTIVSYQKLEAAETPGLGSNLTSPGFMKQFQGLAAARELRVKKDGGGIEAITSATITSRAVCDAVNRARQALDRILKK